LNKAVYERLAAQVSRDDLVQAVTHARPVQVNTLETDLREALRKPTGGNLELLGAGLLHIMQRHLQSRAARECDEGD
jgi:hypothetical protein